MSPGWVSIKAKAQSRLYRIERVDPGATTRMKVKNHFLSTAAFDVASA